MSQLQEVELPKSPAPMFTNKHQQKQTRFYTPPRGRRLEGVQDLTTFRNSYRLGTLEKNSVTGSTNYPSIPSTTHHDVRGSPEPSLLPGVLRVSTPSNIGKRRDHVASLIASPPRASHSNKISKIFQDAHTNLINASRKPFGMQNSPIPKLSTSRHCRACGSQHPSPALCGEATTPGAARSWDLANTGRPQHTTVPQILSDRDCIVADTARSHSTMEQSISGLETTTRAASNEIFHTPGNTAPIYDTVVKYKTEDGSPQLPPFEPLGDLFKDVAGLMGPPNPVTPPYERSTEHPLSSAPHLASPSRDKVVCPSTGTWSDDHIFLPGPPKTAHEPQSPLSQSWTDDSKFYHGPSPTVRPQSMPTNKQSNKETVLSWLDIVNPATGEQPFSPPFTDQRNGGKMATDEFNINHENADVRRTERISSDRLSRPSTPSPRLRRSDSTCSSPPRVTSDSQSPPLSPLSPNVEIERGKRRRPRSRTASFYDTDILKAQEELRKKEERRKARLRRYGC